MALSIVLPLTAVLAIFGCGSGVLGSHSSPKSSSSASSISSALHARPNDTKSKFIALTSSQGPSGLIVLGGPVPAPDPALIGNSLRSVLAFDATSSISTPTWLEIDRGSSIVRLKEGDKTIEETITTTPIALASGHYEIVHKQRSPLWYANDLYFEKRGMGVPAEGSKERYLRGALGDFALFVKPSEDAADHSKKQNLDEVSQLHCGPAWSEEIGGAQLAEGPMSKIYYSLEVGSPIIVK